VICRSFVLNQSQYCCNGAIAAASLAAKRIN